MEGRTRWVGRLGRFVQRHFLALVLAAYAVAALWPGLGAAAREITVARLSVGQERVAVSLPMLLLAGLLFHAGLATRAAEVVQVVRRPQAVLAGLVANLLVPVAFLFLLFQALRLWHNADESQTLLVGLAVVAAMPIAGSSTAWAQNSHGNTALSLGLVVLSTLLSPLTTPLTLRAVGALATGDYAAGLRELGGRQTGTFLLLCVALPSLAGLVVRKILGEVRVNEFKPSLQLGNGLALLFLCYANASASLPDLVAQPDWDFLAVIVAAVAMLCLAAFAAGWGVARLLGVDEAQQRSLLFGLGMSNNGTGLVLATAGLAALPGAAVPVLAYNLVQHLVAGGVNWSLLRAAPQVARR
jgi:BASS family bile acid:Na+ symporter